MVYTFFDPICIAEACYDLTSILRGFSGAVLGVGSRKAKMKTKDPFGN